MGKTILVTGGSGKLGRAVIADLRQHGYEVRNADRQPLEAVRTVHTDLCNLGQVYGVMHGVDAVAHLAAIPAPGGYPPEVVFQNNVISTFNVLQAAAVLGIKKVVLAGSLSALGLAYKFRPVTLQYLPIDEAHPMLAQDAYGISKIVGDEVARGFARRDPALSLITLHLPLLTEDVQQTAAHLRQRLDFGATVLWSYLDTRDAAAVIRQALELGHTGHDIFYLAAPTTFADVPTGDLIRTYYPDVPFDPARLPGITSPIDCRRATEILGFNPLLTI